MAIADSQFDSMTLSDIFEHGYFIEASINRDIGHTVHHFDTKVDVSSYGRLGLGCFISLNGRRNLHPMILKKGRSILLDSSYPTRPGGYGIGASLGIQNEKFLKGMEVSNLKSNFPDITLGKMKEACDLKFKVIKGDWAPYQEI